MSAANSPTCDARTGTLAGEWSFLPLWCRTQRGLTRYTDVNGVERRYCAHHGPLVRHRYPVKTASPLRDACILCKRDIQDDLYILVSHGAGTAPLCWRCQEQGDES